MRERILGYLAYARVYGYTYKQEEKWKNHPKFFVAVVIMKCKETVTTISVGLNRGGRRTLCE